MCPQPLNTITQNAEIAVSPDALAQRPVLAALIAEAIGAWSQTEMTLGILLARMLGANARPAMVMYSALESFQPQMRALDAVSRSILVGDDLELFSATLIVIRRAAHQRHLLGHSVWAFAPQLPHDLLLIDPKDMWGWSATVFEWADAMRTTPPPRPPMPKAISALDHGKVLVFSEGDLKSIVQRLRRAHGYAGLLSLLISRSETIDSTRRLLRNEPEIRSALDRNRSQTNRFSALPEPRQTTDVY